MLPAKHFYMIRHGETEANAAQIMAGRLDTPLTAKGREQAMAAGRVLAALPIRPQAIYHSTLSRARDTAMIMNEELNLPLFADHDLQEIHAGDLEGAPYEECRALFTGWPNLPNGETHLNFFERIKRGKLRALSGSHEPVLIVCHGGVMRALGELYGISPPARFANAHLYEFTPVRSDSASSSGSKTDFPWEVWDYRLCQERGTLIKNRSDFYNPA